MDHLQIRTVFGVQNARTLNTIANSFWGKAGIVLQYALWRSGPMSMAPSQFGMFTKSDPALATPDLEYHVQPLSTDRLGDPLHPYPAITMSVCNLRPESRGTCHVITTDLDDAARDQAQLPRHRARPPHCGGVGTSGTPDHGGGGAEALRAQGAVCRAPRFSRTAIS